jgi:hypothetical protein
MRAAVRHVIDHGVEYDCLAFCCPGCAEADSNSGLHMLPVNTTVHSPSWTWDGNLDAPTLEPSILTKSGPDPALSTSVCHSFVRAGSFEFLADSTHSLAGQTVPMPDLPSWAIEDG